jgi:hypothetical protein
MDPGALVLVGLAWMVLSAVRKAGSKPPGTRPPPGTQRPPTPRAPIPRQAPGSPPAPGARAHPLPPVGGKDATQLEGRRLEELLRDLGRTLDQAAGPMGREPDRRLPPAEEVEEGQSLETMPRVRSLETEPNRPERVRVDHDDDAEQVVARRIAAAEARSGPRSRADHQTFDQRIRREPADKTATRALTRRQLRDAVVWREILGPPVSLRDEREA